MWVERDRFWDGLKTDCINVFQILKQTYLKKKKKVELGHLSFKSQLQWVECT